MSTTRRRNRSDAGRRTFGGRTLVALVATAALTLGPGAMSALADDSASTDPGATSEVALAAPALDPAPTPEPPAPQPEPAPAPEPPAPEAPAPAPETPVPDPQPEPEAPPTDEPVDTAEPTPESDEAAPEESRVVEESEPVDESDLGDEAARNGDDNPQNMIKLCRATGSEKNPWVMLMLNANGVINGHASQHESDIIPPFEYTDKGKPAYFPGQNLTAENLAIWNNDCEEIKPPPPNPVVMVTVEQCVVPNGVVPSTVGISISNLVNKFSYTLVVTGPNGFVSETPVTHTDGTAYIDQAIPGPGDYVATVTGMKGKGDDSSKSESHSKVTVTGMQEFTVNDCPAPPPPPPPASVTPVVTITPALPITSAPQALAVTGSPDNDSGITAGLLLLLGAGAALLATGAHRGVRSRL